MSLLNLIEKHGLAVEFIAALLSQAGLPFPAEPAMVIAGAFAMSGRWGAEMAWLVAALAALLADHAWFLAGRWRGRSLLSLLCRISLSPDTCVRHADNLLLRFGPGVLLLAKLIPGVAAVAIPTAAASGMSYKRFLLFDGAGALLWAGLWVGVGMILSREIDMALGVLERSGPWMVAVVVLLLAIFIGGKYLERRRLTSLYRARRIQPDEVATLVEEGKPLVILDARSDLAWQDDPRALPKAMRVPSPEDAVAIAGRFSDHMLVAFCTCPSEASAAVLAHRLILAGYTDVRVLAGGTQAIELLHPLTLGTTTL